MVNDIEAEILRVNSGFYKSRPLSFKCDIENTGDKTWACVS